MHRNIWRRGLAVGAAAILVLGLAGAAQAQGKKGKGGPPVVVGGEVVSYGGGKLTFKTKGGETVSVMVAKKPRVTALTRIKFGELKPNDYIASTAIRQKDGTLRAVEVRIFPEALRGRGEGHRPFPGGPNYTMTNATVEALVGGVSGRTIKVKFKGGEKVITVPTDVPVMRMGRGSPAMLKPGAHVSVFARKQGDGIHAVRISVGVGDLVPPS